MSREGESAAEKLVGDYVHILGKSSKAIADDPLVMQQIFMEASITDAKNDIPGIVVYDDKKKRRIEFKNRRGNKSPFG